MQACTIGIPDITPGGTLRLSPNPSPGIVFVVISDVSGSYALTLSDVSGRQVLGKTVNGTSATIDLGYLPAGLYFLTLTGNTTIRTGKLIKL